MSKAAIPTAECTSEIANPLKDILGSSKSDGPEYLSLMSQFRSYLDPGVDYSKFIYVPDARVNPGKSAGPLNFTEISDKIETVSMLSSIKSRITSSDTGKIDGAIQSVIDIFDQTDVNIQFYNEQLNRKNYLWYKNCKLGKGGITLVQWNNHFERCSPEFFHALVLVEDQIQSHKSKMIHWGNVIKMKYISISLLLKAIAACINYSEYAAKDFPQKLNTIVLEKARKRTEAIQTLKEHLSTLKPAGNYWDYPIPQ